LYTIPFTVNGITLITPNNNMTVKEAIETLKTMPQDAELVIYHENCGCCGPQSARSVHTEDIPSKIRDVHLTVVVIEDK
jgi:uncharacterized protein (DUF779 family)